MVSLEEVSTDDLRDALAEVEGKKPTQRLMAVINYLEEDDATMTGIAERYGYTGGWLSRWLDRLDRLVGEPVEKVVYDEPREGRPAELSDEEYDQFVEALHESPEEIGFAPPAWSVPLARHYLTEEFGVEYCEHHVRRLLSEAKLSWKTARPSTTSPTNGHRTPGKRGSKKARRPGRRIHDPDHQSDATGALDADLRVVS